MRLPVNIHVIVVCADNAGVEGDVIVEKLLGQDFEIGYNAMYDRVENLIDVGVLDPAKVVRSGLTNACSIAGIMLTTQVRASFRFIFCGRVGGAVWGAHVGGTGGYRINVGIPPGKDCALTARKRLLHCGTKLTTQPFFMFMGCARALWMGGISI